MKTNEIKKFLKKNQTALLIVIGVVVVAVVVWIVYKKKNGLNKEDIVNTEQFTGQEITSGMPWRDMAARLRKAFGGPNSSGTDEDEVYNVLGMLRNNADWDYLKRYWISYYESLPWYNRFNDYIMNASNNNSLVNLLKYELDNSELQHCRDILTAKGITPDI